MWNYVFFAIFKKNMPVANYAIIPWWLQTSLIYLFGHFDQFSECCLTPTIHLMGLKLSSSNTFFQKEEKYSHQRRKNKR